jgi:hypothetical protein
MKKRMGFVAAVLWAVAGLVACGAGESGGTENTGETKQALTCPPPEVVCHGCRGVLYCNDSPCPYCHLVGNNCECE